jgi:hypothetical protein
VLAGLSPEGASEVIELNAFEQKALDTRLEASRSAQERTRVTSFASTVISLAIITAGWNAYFSFYHDFASEFPSLEGGAGTTNLQREMLSEWVRGRMINITLLGIRVGVDDAPLLGAIALSIAAIWLYYSIRRENYTIGTLLFDYYYANDHIRWLVYHGINSATVFTNVIHGDAPFRSSTQEPPNRPLRSVRFMAGCLWYLPIFSLWFIIFVDILSAVWWSSPFREPDIRGIFEEIRNDGTLRKNFSEFPDRPWTRLKRDERANVARTLEQAGIIEARHAPWGTMKPPGRRHLILRWLTGVIISLPLLLMCFRIAAFAGGTEAALKEFRESLRKIEPSSDANRLSLDEDLSSIG